MYGMTKVAAGEYRTKDGRFAIIREDGPSEDEDGYVATGWENRVWYVIPANKAHVYALPDALFEGDTMRACVAWTETQ